MIIIDENNIDKLGDFVHRFEITNNETGRSFEFENFGLTPDAAASVIMFYNFKGWDFNKDFSIRHITK